MLDKTLAELDALLKQQVMDSDRDGYYTIAEMAEAKGVSRASMTRLLRDAHRAGLIEDQRTITVRGFFDDTKRYRAQAFKLRTGGKK